MELRQLKTFIAVAEHLHFGRAAAQLHIVQSAISQQIKLLEEGLGVQLLERSRHHVALTEAGRTFLTEAQRTLRQAERAVDAARAIGSGAAGRLEIGFIDNALWSPLPDMLRAFHDRHPLIRLKLHQLHRVDQIEGLREGRLDIGLLPAPSSIPGLAAETMLQAEFWVALPPDHPAAARADIDLGTLANEPFVMFPPAMRTRLAEMVIAACAAAGFSPNVVQEAWQIHTLLALVKAGLGITLVPAWAAAAHASGIVYRPLRDAMPNYELIMTWREDGTNPAVATFRQLVRDMLGDDPQG